VSFPLPPNEEQRLEELRRYTVLDTPPEKAFATRNEALDRNEADPAASP
jgi:hypothetical protein